MCVALPSQAEVSPIPATETQPQAPQPPAAKIEEREAPTSQEPQPPSSAASTSQADTDLWMRIRRGFTLNDMDSPFVKNHEAWYATRPDYIQRFVDRGSKYLYHVVEEVERRGMPTEIALLPVIESAFNPQAYSRAKAAGMWQFIPSTGKNYGLKQDSLADHRRDVLLSTRAAMDYLQKLYAMFNSWELALAAYNCGEGCVSRAVQKNVRKGLPTDYQSLNLPKETKNYVPKLIAIKNIILAPGNFGIDLMPMENRPYFAKVAAPVQMDAHLAARLAEMSDADFAALNPASTKPVATTDSGFFLVPADKAVTFIENLDLYRSLNGPLVSWQTAQAKRGEAIDVVAKRYGMTASYLRATSGPFKEKKGKLTQPISIMVPLAKEAKLMSVTLDQKALLKASRRETAAASGTFVLAPVENDTPETEARIAVTTPITSPVVTTTEVIVAVPNKARTTPVAKIQRAVQTYVVKRGDTLFAIAIKYGVELTDLLRWNRLTERTVLQPGRKLRIESV